MTSSAHPLRIFSFSSAITLVTFIVVWMFLGPQAALLTALLSVIELTFSFDNAIINARVLKRLSPLWQQLFLTIGILFAVFGMRLVFPIAIVAITAGMSWQTVLDLSLNHPEQYTAALHEAQPLIAAFGGGFLLMLGLHYFFDPKRDLFWLPIEKTLARVGSWWLPLVISIVIMGGLALLAGEDHARDIMGAGVCGIIVYLAIHLLSETLYKRNEGKGDKVQTGWAAFWTFVYLQILDASFSFDGVIGAFAITSDVIIIAAGLGVGAFWVRSMTVYMVRKGVLDQYRYLEHGAHYTILLLAAVMLGSLFFHLPEAVPGLLGLLVISTSIYSSRKLKKAALA